MNKYFILALCVISASLNCCRNSEKVKIGYLIPNLKGERYIREQTFFKEKMAALGGDALVASADYDDKLQIQQAKDLISQGAKVLVVNSVNMNTAAAIVRYAHDHKVKVIAYDRLIRNCNLDYYISYDNIKVGRLMADYIVKQKPRGNFLLIGGDKADLNAVLVKNGQMEILNNSIQNGNIKILYDVFIEDWSGENAYPELKKFLSLSDQIPDAILSSNDEMALGCIRALKECDLAGKVMITGQDAELEACKNIVSGYQTMTIYKPLKVLAEKAAEIAFKMAAKEKFEDATSTMNNGQKDVPAMLLDPLIVDKNNMKSTVIADGFYSESQIMN